MNQKLVRRQRGLRRPGSSRNCGDNLHGGRLLEEMVGSQKGTERVVQGGRKKRKERRMKNVKPWGLIVTCQFKEKSPAGEVKGIRQVKQRENKGGSSGRSHSRMGGVCDRGDIGGLRILLGGGVSCGSEHPNRRGKISR